MRSQLLGGLIVIAAVACTTGSPATDATPTPATVAPSAASSPADVVCAGPKVDWSIVPAIVEAYGRAWNERDPAIRLAYLEESLADDASYVDVSMDRPVVGRTAISDMIGTFQNGLPEYYFEPTTWADDYHHHDRYRIRWRFCNDRGTVEFEGEDIGLVDGDGRFVEIVGWQE